MSDTPHGPDSTDWMMDDRRSSTDGVREKEREGEMSIHLPPAIPIPIRRRLLLLLLLLLLWCGHHVRDVRRSVRRGVRMHAVMMIRMMRVRSRSRGRHGVDRARVLHLELVRGRARRGSELVALLSVHRRHRNGRARVRARWRAALSTRLLLLLRG